MLIERLGKEKSDFLWYGGVLRNQSVGELVLIFGGLGVSGRLGREGELIVIFGEWRRSCHWRRQVYLSLRRASWYRHFEVDF